MIETLILTIVGLGQFNCSIVELRPNPTLECVMVAEETIKIEDEVKQLNPFVPSIRRPQAEA